MIIIQYPKKLVYHTKYAGQPAPLAAGALPTARTTLIFHMRIGPVHPKEDGTERIAQFRHTRYEPPNEHEQRGIKK